MLSYDNKLCGAYLAAGRSAEYMDKLLKEVQAVKPENAAALEVQFPRGSIGAIVEEHPELLPKCK